MYAIRRARPDGSCLFHSIGHFTGHVGQELRIIAIKEVLLKRDTLFNDLKLSDWIYMETQLSIEEYARRLSTMWGGLVEMKLLSEYFYRPIVVYSRSRSNQAIRILVIEPSPKEECATGGPIMLLYSGNNHYDSLAFKAEN